MSNKTFQPNRASGAQRKQRAAKVAPQNTFLRQVLSSSGVMIFAAIFLALLISALLVVLFDQRFQETVTYLAARPSDALGAAGSAFGAFFTSLFRGAIFDYEATTVVGAFQPIFNTLTRSTPLILAGLSVGLAFKAGLFNIGAQGQVVIGALFAAYAGFALNLPPVIHLLFCVVMAILGGAIYGFIPGILKAKVGANEVIVTIMLNSVAVYLLTYLLKTKTFIGSGYPGKSMSIAPQAGYPRLLGESFPLHLGFIVALLAAVFVWWLLERSTFGFELRAAGANPDAARTAGVSVNRVIALTMMVAGSLAGLAGTAPVLGTEKYVSGGTAGSLGFDAITVALLGQGNPVGIVLAGILFGAFAAGASTMQAAAGIPVDIVSVSQAVIVLLIAAPPLIRLIFRLPTPIDPRVAAKEAELAEAAAKAAASAESEAAAAQTPVAGQPGVAGGSQNGEEPQPKAEDSTGEEAAK